MEEVIAWIIGIVEYLFKDNYGNPVRLTSKQAVVVKKIVFLESPRLVIAAYTGYGKCHGKGTKIIMYDGSIKNVEDIKEGDYLMGDNSSPRRVLSIVKGKGNLYKVNQNKGDSYVVNEDHILSLKMNHNRQHPVTKEVIKKGEIIDISVKDYLNSSKAFKWCAKGYKKGFDFPYRPVSIDPYFLGLWLGDGLNYKPSICGMDKEIIDYVKNYSKKLNLNFSISKDIRNLNSNVYNIIGFNKKNYLWNKFKKLNLNKNKHIPKEYLINNKEVRLQLLAGLIDTDGSFNRNCYDFIQKDKELSEQIAFLARSLGFNVKISKCIKSIKNIGFKGEYYRLSISGDTNTIPVRIPRKKCTKRSINKNCLSTGISIESIGIGDYYGFVIDGNHRYLLGDFTVTHNTYVVAIALFLCAIVNLGVRIGIISASKKQSSLCYDYILGFISREPKLWELVGARSRDLKDLANALNKERLSVGKDEIKSSIGIFTANLNAQGSNLLGLHFDIVLEDESVLIPDELEKTKILRMLEKSPNDVLPKIHVKISTTHDINHFKKWVDNVDIDKVIIDAEDGFIEGRLTREFINTQKEELGELFNIWYMCKFPELGSDKLLTYAEIKSLLVSKVLDKNLKGNNVLSVDVARFGTNKTVITLINKNDFGYFSKCLSFHQGKDTVYTYGVVKSLIVKNGVKIVIIDDCGVGGGVTDMLRKDEELKILKVSVQPFNAGKPCKNKKDALKYVNQGTKSYLFLKELIRKDFIVYESNKFITGELESITKEFTPTGQLRVFKKGVNIDSDASPDFVDSLVIGLSYWWQGSAVIQVFNDFVENEDIEYK
ncbi:MAG: Hint domain-containing homing endonuclease [Candidatus Nanoarchaeia archaeon]